MGYDGVVILKTRLKVSKQAKNFNVTRSLIFKETMGICIWMRMENMKNNMVFANGNLFLLISKSENIYCCH